MLFKKLLGLVEKTSGLVNASFSLPEWQAVKNIFFAPCFKLKISTQILHTSPIVSAVMRRRICFTVKTLHVNPFPFFLMTFNYVVIEIFRFVHSWKKWEGFRISFFFFFVGEDGWNFLEMGEPKLTAYLWYCRKKKMTTSCTRARTQNACD